MCYPIHMSLPWYGAESYRQGSKIASQRSTQCTEDRMTSMVDMESDKCVQAG